MDKYQLRSEISSLERECSQLERECSQLQSELNAIVSAASSATTAVVRSRDNAVRTLDNSTNLVAYSNQMMNGVIAEQEHIKVLYRGFKNVETANKRIRELTNHIYFEFSNFRMVRKIVRAFVDNMNLDMVRPEIIEKSVEKEHLQSPDFWLSCSMLAVMHWKDDRQEAANRALQKAMELDARQTTLFFMAFNLLVGRRDAALKWFRCYRDMPKTGHDANVILLLLHATNLREPGKDPLSQEIADYLKAEYGRSLSLNDMTKVVLGIKSHFLHFNTTETFSFDVLRSYVKDYSTMANALSMAKDNQAVLAYVESVNTTTLSRGQVFIERFINEVLDTPDQKERAYTDEIAYNEMIIKCVGDLTRAHEEFKKAKEKVDAPLNLLAECIDWLFAPSMPGVSELAKSNMFILCRDVIIMAYKAYVSEYRGAMSKTHPVAIKDYATTMNFEDKAGEMKKAEAFYEQKKANQIASVKNTNVILCIVFAVLALAGGIASFIGVGAALGIVCIVLSLALGGGAFLCIKSNQKKKEDIAKACDAALAKTRQVIEALFTDFAEYCKVFAEKDRIAKDVAFAIKR